MKRKYTIEVAAIRPAHTAVAIFFFLPSILMNLMRTARPIGAMVSTKFHQRLLPKLSALCPRWKRKVPAISTKYAPQRKMGILFHLMTERRMRRALTAAKTTATRGKKFHPVAHMTIIKRYATAA